MTEAEAILLGLKIAQRCASVKISFYLTLVFAKSGESRHVSPLDSRFYVEKYKLLISGAEYVCMWMYPGTLVWVWPPNACQ